MTLYDRLKTRPRAGRRRGVASVLAMMFLVIFGSLAAVMAVVAQGNLRTADSYLHVTRATSEAEKGLIFAQRRLGEQTRRFVVTKGVVDDDFGEKLWFGTYGPTDGDVIVHPPVGFAENPPATGVAEAMLNAHSADLHSIDVEPGDELLPDVDEFGTLRTKPVGTWIDQSQNIPGPYFRLKYEILSDSRFLRVTSQGVDGDVTRTLQMDFQIVKRIKYAVISPNRIMVGKNVRIEGPLGTRYGIVPGELDPDNGNPLVMRSDFYHLDDALDTQLDALYAQIALHDVDGDSRLRPEHPTEINGLTEAYMIDYDNNEYVDDFDLFLAFFDNDGDGRIVYDEDLAAAAGYGGLPYEFSVDDQLGHLIDHARPDRNEDGVVTGYDVSLGYGDGVIDARDYYSKIDGEVAFAVAQADWETARGGQDYQTFVNGPVRPGIDEPPVSFEVDTDVLLDITTADLDNSDNWFYDTAQAGAAFWDQVAAGQAAGGIYTQASDAPWETVPYGAKGYYDWYQRPTFENMTFTNVTIPVGLNGLFIGCTFVGVTYVESTVDNTDVNWNYVGMMDRNPSTGVMEEKYPGLTTDAGDTDTKDDSNNVRFHNCTFAGSVATTTTLEFTHVRNKLQFTGQTWFTLDHPDLDPDAIPELKKSSIFAPGYSVDVGDFTNSNTDVVELNGTILAGVLDARGTVDVHGTVFMTFRPVESAGPLFYGGGPDGFNTTLGYFGPDDGDAESVDPSDLVDTDGDGLPDIGEDLDGDGINDPFMGFGEVTLRYNPRALLPDGIPWPVSVQAVGGSYIEGGTM